MSDNSGFTVRYRYCTYAQCDTGFTYCTRSCNRYKAYIQHFLTFWQQLALLTFEFSSLHVQAESTIHRSEDALSTVPFSCAFTNVQNLSQDCRCIDFATELRIGKMAASSGPTRCICCHTCVQSNSRFT